MKKIWCLLCLLTIPLVTFAQGDLPTAPVVIKGLEAKKDANNPAAETKEETLNLLKAPNIPESPSKTPYDLANKEVDMLNKEVFLNPGEKFKRKAPKTADENRAGGATTTQFLGDFKTDSRYVKIVCRDHQAIDGDRVAIILNDRTINPNVFLDASYKGFVVEMAEGFNKIDFLALNQGASGPNTAAFAVFDENGNLISSNEWNLSTGVRATMVIVREFSPGNPPK